MPTHLILPKANSEEFLYSLEDEAVKDLLNWLLTDIHSQRFSQQVNAQLTDIDYPATLKSLTNNCENLEQSASAFMTLFAKILNKTIEQFSISGLDQLHSDTQYLFISNHRDVLIDPLLINLALQQHNIGNARCAIGSNLLEDALLGAYLRLSGCFVVPRHDMPMRMMILRLRQLSKHIHNLQTQHNIWIAQREGRAKDGWDITNPALIKMLLLNKDKSQDQTSYLKNKNIVPVSISYEWDPSDAEKAEELAIKSANEHAEYRSDSIQHLLNSLFSNKGHVHIAFSQPLAIREQDNPTSIAENLDQFIQSNFILYPSHIVAHKAKKQIPLTSDEQVVLKQLKQRIKNSNNTTIQNNLLDLYANITEQRYRHTGI